MTLSDLAPLANHLWQSTLCVAAVWLLTRVLAKNRAAVRYWLWLAASIKFLIPFSLLVALGSLLPWQGTQSANPAHLQWTYVAENVGQPFSVASPAVEVAGASSSHSLPFILLGVWFCGFVLSISLWFRWSWQIRVARKEARALALGLPIPVMSSPGRIEPGVVGIFRPVLLLPEGIAQRLTPTQLTTVLAHEMHHVRRHDNLTAAIHMLVEAVFWFYPLVWWIRVRLVEERERACDEAVLQSGSEAEAYAEGILNVCKFYVESPLACVSGISGADLKKRVVRILTRGRSEKLNSGKKTLLAVVGILAVAAPLIYGFMDSPQMSAQTTPLPSVEPVPSFEVASIKLNRSGDNRVLMQFPDDRCTITGMSIKLLIMTAYDVRDFQLSEGPSWIDSDRFDVNAKLEDSLAEKLKKLPRDEVREQHRLILQSLLADRFHLKVSHETKDLPIYALVIAKSGLKIQLAKPGDNYPNGFKGPNGSTGTGMFLHTDIRGESELTDQGLPVANLARELSQQLRRTVIDKTGLTGNYDFTLKWTPEESTPMLKGPDGSHGPAEAPPPDSPGPSIFTALQEQLGLKLESQKGPVEILVIDHVEKPSEN